MNQTKIDRINALAHKAKTGNLTEAEQAEQASLRREYIAGYRASLTTVLNNTYIQQPDGTKTKLKKRDGKRSVHIGIYETCEF